MYIGVPFTKIVQIFRSVVKHGHQGAELVFLICELLKLKKSSCPKVLARFENYFAQMFIGAPFTKMVQIFPIGWKTWPPGGGACFPYMFIVQILKIFLSKSTGPIWKLFCTNVPRGTLYQDCSNIPIRWKTWPPGGGACFPYMCIVKT